MDLVASSDSFLDVLGNVALPGLHENSHGLIVFFRVDVNYQFVGYLVLGFNSPAFAAEFFRGNSNPVSMFYAAMGHVRQRAKSVAGTQHDRLWSGRKV